MLVLNGDYDEPVGGPPTANGTEIGHIWAQTVTEDDYFPFFVLNWILEVEVGVAEDWHFDFADEGHDELEGEEG